jgi:hypothetical protein
MSELTAVPAPAPTPTPGMNKLAAVPAGDLGGDGNEISVLLAAKRLQVTADVDEAGLEKREKMLAKYKEILKLQ